MVKELKGERARLTGELKRIDSALRAVEAAWPSTAPKTRSRFKGAARTPHRARGSIVQWVVEAAKRGPLTTRRVRTEFGPGAGSTLTHLCRMGKLERLGRGIYGVTGSTAEG